MTTLRIFNPAGHRLVVRLFKSELAKKVEQSKLVIPECAKEVTQTKHGVQEAYVHRIGKDAFKIFGDGEPWCKIGDHVLIAKYSGHDTVDEETGDIYRVINDEDVFGVFQE